MNLVALDNRIEPDGIEAAATTLAGDKLSEAKADGSML